MVENILKLLQSVGKSEFSLEKEIGIAQGSIKHWRTAKSKPSTDAVIKIAKYFNVSADYLLGTEPTDEDKAQGFGTFAYLTSEEQELIMYFNEIGDRLGSEAQKALITYAKFVAEGSKK